MRMCSLASAAIWRNSFSSPAPLAVCPCRLPNCSASFLIPLNARADSQTIPAALPHIHLSLRRPPGEEHSLLEMPHTVTTSKPGSFFQFVFFCQTPFITGTRFTATRRLFRQKPSRSTRGSNPPSIKELHCCRATGAVFFTFSSLHVALPFHLRGPVCNIWLVIFSLKLPALSTFIIYWYFFHCVFYVRKQITATKK